jgi:predicted PurR-regulated permease PerM
LSHPSPVLRSGTAFDRTGTRALIGFAAGVIGFIPYLGSLLGVVVSTCSAIARFWPDWTLIWLMPAVFFFRAIAGGLCAGALLGESVRAS